MSENRVNVRQVLVLLMTFGLIAVFVPMAAAQEWQPCWDCESSGNFLFQVVRCCRGNCSNAGADTATCCHRDQDGYNVTTMGLETCFVVSTPFPHCDGPACVGGGDSGSDFKPWIWDSLGDDGDGGVDPCSGTFDCPAECAQCGGVWRP